MTVFSRLLRVLPQTPALIRTITMKIQIAKTKPCINHDEKNMKLKRPQSPHLTIYAPQLTSLLSISHRGTGLFIGFFLMTMGWGTFFYEPKTYEKNIQSLEDANVGFAPLMVLKYILAFPMCYHYSNGIRHLFWDFGKCLKIKQVYSTGYLMLFATLVSASALSTYPYLLAEDEPEPEILIEYDAKGKPIKPKPGQPPKYKPLPPGKKYRRKPKDPNAANAVNIDPKAAIVEKAKEKVKEKVKTE